MLSHLPSLNCRKKNWHLIGKETKAKLAKEGGARLGLNPTIPDFIVIIITIITIIINIIIVTTLIPNHLQPCRASSYLGSEPPRQGRWWWSTRRQWRSLDHHQECHRNYHHHMCHQKAASLFNRLTFSALPLQLFRSVSGNVHCCATSVHSGDPATWSAAVHCCCTVAHCTALHWAAELHCRLLQWGAVQAQLHVQALQWSAQQRTFGRWWWWRWKWQGGRIYLHFPQWPRISGKLTQYCNSGLILLTMWKNLWHQRCANSSFKMKHDFQPLRLCHWKAAGRLMRGFDGQDKAPMVHKQIGSWKWRQCEILGFWNFQIEKFLQLCCFLTVVRQLWRQIQINSSVLCLTAALYILYNQSTTSPSRICDSCSCSVT